MAKANCCPECGESLSPGATPGEYCPRCLLKLGLEAETDPGSTTPPEPVAGTEGPEPVEGTESTEISAVESTRTDRIGPYRLTRKLGEGGMGEVYEAEQQEPVRRKVALKLIKWGMDTRRVVARFEAERQALAMMDHPNIARVFDAGATEQGRPYFAMELVKGVPITDYCDRHKLSTRQRLELFQLVCEGVQHAHQKGIIHRDIKPSNVMVTIQDDKPVPKIIDFGVAKATEQRLTEKTVFTELGQLVGTPEYMSPEQAEMTGLDIDTRTDVYSLGVLLYELLSGALPFEPRELRKAGYDEIRRRIREDEPAKPSTRISSLGEEATTAASNRKTAPAALVRHLRGDLDWISMKALEKDRTRRYGSAADLAADLGRHLQSEPVLAGPPSTAYKMKKFVRRHRFGVAAASVVSLALVLGVIGTSVGMIRARAETRRAEAGKLFALGREILEDNPSGALAYATESLELSDEPDVRQFALRALWRGPTAFVVEMPEFSLSVDFEPGGNRLAAGGWGGLHQLWNPDGSTVIWPRTRHDVAEETTGSEARLTTHEEDELVFVDFSDDGRYHVSSSDKGVHVWSVAEERELRLLDLQPWWFEVRGDDLLALTQIGDGTRFSIERWPLGGGDPTAIGEWTRPGSLGDPYALLRVDVDPSGEWLAYAEGPDLLLLPLEQAPHAPAHRVGRGESAITRVYFLPDGERIVTFEPTGNDEGVIRLWSRSAKSIGPLRVIHAPIPEFRDAPAVRGRTISFDSSGRWMSAPTVFEATILLWDLEAPPGTEPLTLIRGKTESAATNSVALHPRGTWLASGDANLALWPLSNKYSRVLHRQSSSISPAGFHPRGDWLASASWDGKIRLWPLTGKGQDDRRVLFDGELPLGTPVWAPDGDRIAATLWDGRIIIVPLSGAPPTELHGFSSPVSGLGFDREGRRLAAGGGIKLAHDAVIRVWNLETGEVQILDSGDGKGLFDVGFTPDGELVSCGDGGLLLWDLETGTSEQLFSERIMDCRTSPDGHSVLMVGSNEGKVISNRTPVLVYDLHARSVQELPGYGHRVFTAVWHPSGRFIATGGLDGVIRVGPVTGDEPHLLVGHVGLTQVGVSGDGEWILSGGNDGTLRLWPWPSGQPVQALPHDESVAKLRSLTNFRVLKDETALTGYRLRVGRFPGWEEFPTW